MDQTNPNNSTTAMPKKYKVVLLGDQAVGKSSIIKAYGDQEFNPDTDVLFD
jgi:GTPase SAR1 family protein